jgi:AcrR family transcriptional regulator
MTQETSASDRILDAAEQALRRFGVDKTNVVDVARALNMSHGNIYRYFPNKKSLLLAIAERWLVKMMAPLDDIAADDQRPAANRLLDWLEKIRVAKRKKLQDDPEVFRIHFGIVAEAPEVLARHVEHMRAQIEKIMRDGIAAGELAPAMDAPMAAKTFLQASLAFYHPALVMSGPAPSKADAEALVGVLLDGLRKRPRR